MSRPPRPFRRSPAAIALLLLVGAAGAAGDPPSPRPLTNEDIVRLVVNGTEPRVILEEIASRPVDFDLDEEVVVELRLVGVEDRIIEAMRVRQRDMPGNAGEDQVEGDSLPAGFLVVDLSHGEASASGNDTAPFAIRALPDGVERSPGMEVGLVSDLALAVLCRTPDHVPDHWDLHSPIEQAPRHRVLYFRPASRADVVKKFEILRLDLTTTPPIEVTAGRHALIVALAGRSTGSGAWHLLASDPVTVDVLPAVTLHLPLRASSALQGNRMAGYGVEHRWQVTLAEEEGAE